MPVATSTMEDYLKQIYMLQQDLEAGRLVLLGRIAAAVGVVPGTATTMVKALDESGLVHYESRRGARLTPAGERLALRVVRRHRLVELFLVKVLNFDWADVHEEADRLEHVISDRLVDRLDDFLGSPAYDPHGDPIPSVNGRMKQRSLIPLVDAVPGETMVIARIADQSSEFLSYATAHGLKPGVRVVVRRLDAIGDFVVVQAGTDRELTLGTPAARKISVRPAS